jgi:rhodanese-related sulfurtransferase
MFRKIFIFDFTPAVRSSRITWDSRPGGAGADPGGRGRRGRQAIARPRAAVCSLGHDAGRYAPVPGRPPHRLVAARVTLPAVAESRLLHLAVGGFFLPAWKKAAGFRQVRSRHQHHGSAARGRLDLAGASLYVGAYFAVGFLFSGAIEVIMAAFRTLGRVVDAILIVGVIAYLGFQIWTWRKARVPSLVPSVPPSEAASSEGAIIYDVRSHGYYDRKAIRIRGSQRLEPNGLPRFDESAVAPTRVFLYCTCIRDATSVRVAQELLDRGMECAVIRGGLQAWKKAGLPVESVPSEELTLLPSFD